MTTGSWTAQRGQALPEYLMTVALITMLVSIFVVTLTPAVIEVVVMLVNHMAVYLSSV